MFNNFEQPKNAQFFLVNRQHLVHLEAMESYQGDELGRLLIKLKEPLQETLMGSKDKAAEFRRWFG